LILVGPSAGPESSGIQGNREAVRKLGLGIAAVSAKIHPGWYVLDARGVIVSKYFDDSARYTPAAILVHQFGWTPPEPAVEVKGKQLTAKVSASNATLAPGERVTLILDIDLNPNMHVYAPGVDGYIPIDWKMQDPQTANVQPAIFPPSQKLYLEAIGETVPTYHGHFRLMRDISITSEDQLRPALDPSGALTVPGSLRYQACDDRLCYIPQEMHLSWTFSVSTPVAPN
jgi:DsbC/DsbD-like thiol-disulfide interchange protein